MQHCTLRFRFRHRAFITMKISPSFEPHVWNPAEPHPVILVATGIQGPDYAPARSWQQIFGGWTAASHPALSLQHNLYYYENSPFSPSCVAPAGHPVILVATGIQGPDYAPARSWQQIFGGWTAASHPGPFPSAQLLLHTTRAPDSRCGKSDGGFEDNRQTLALGNSSEGGSAAMNAPPS